MSRGDPAGRRWPGSLIGGVVAALAVIALVAAPFSLPGTGVWVYYARPAVGPVAVGVLAAFFALVGALGPLFRIWPAIVGGALLALSLAMVGITVFWLTRVSEAIVFSLSTVDALRYHRWALLGFALAALVCAAWYAGASVARRSTAGRTGQAADGDSRS
ncbi:DUF7548 family protein [Halegenticoccus soli]|uniref:DUF7548 family protein n=1 Tax=Halegenticoccus soli TaxID=1985678 RepID=UPI000C6CC49A|nr:hypothetical protein [Halegenticoccus soli]